MINISKKTECCGCYGCYNVCPKKCISMEVDNEGFWYPKVDEDKCIDCNLCEKVCPIINTNISNSEDYKAYACKNKDENIRLKSSSGGVFSILCEEVINNNGAVFGAKFDEKLNVIHDYSEDLEGCSKFRGSKYVQSKIGESYKIVEQKLKNGQIVLFSSTPCQVSGLQSYLRKDYENLITVDIACHGVPSPLVYRRYIESLNYNNDDEIVNLEFRDKSTGWKNYSFKVDFKNKQFKQLGSENIYMRGFLKDIYIRPSCHECKFKKGTTKADITLADYWGVENKHPEFDDNKGVSLVLTSTKKGEEILDKISKKMEFISTDKEYATQCNPCLIRSAKYNPDREKFFDDIDENNIEKNIYKYTKVSLYQKIKNKIFTIIKKLSRVIDSTYTKFLTHGEKNAKNI